MNLASFHPIGLIIGLVVMPHQMQQTVNPQMRQMVGDAL